MFIGNGGDSEGGSCREGSREKGRGRLKGRGGQVVGYLLVQGFEDRVREGKFRG